MSVRTRLTLLYTGLFLTMSAALVGLSYLRVVQAVGDGFSTRDILLRVVPRLGAVSDLQEMSQLPVAERSALFQAELEKIVAEEKQEVLGGLVQDAALLFAVFAAVALLLGHFVAGRTLRPLQRMTATARRLSDSTLHERFALDGPRDEIKDLADTFDAMLDRLHRAFDAQRRFVANASHELRTPLTINRTVLEVALARAAVPEETKALAGTLLATTERHERLVEGLLLLARSENEPQDRRPVDLAALAASALAAVDVPPGLEIAEDLAPAPASGDPVLLERCLVNLLENAVRYNVPGGRVRLRTWREDGRCLARVENTGPFVPEHALEAIYEPFRRHRPDRTGSAGGTGLGLSIVRSVVRAHGGRIGTASRPSGGLVITVSLPSGAGAPVVDGGGGQAEVLGGGVGPEGDAALGGADTA
ncbi:sensor histidine kinase [Actinocorallia populi]|uniref:sensor histidine kinase n=1 Tax=Actinocorallia populi TaxID=2079200 RepID=UPI000D0970A9|nr:ATP-binding protein [Actinocorallia populi]